MQKKSLPTLNPRVLQMHFVTLVLISKSGTNRLVLLFCVLHNLPIIRSGNAVCNCFEVCGALQHPWCENSLPQGQFNQRCGIAFRTISLSSVFREWVIGQQLLVPHLHFSFVCCSLGTFLKLISQWNYKTKLKCYSTSCEWSWNVDLSRFEKPLQKTIIYSYPYC